MSQDDETGAEAPRSASPPHPEVVAQIAVNLAQLSAEPASAEQLDAVRADIQTYGLPAFFQAAQQQLLAERVLVPAAAPALPLVPAAAPALPLPAEAFVLFPRGDEGR